MRIIETNFVDGVSPNRARQFIQGKVFSGIGSVFDLQGGQLRRLLKHGSGGAGRDGACSDLKQLESPVHDSNDHG